MSLTAREAAWLTITLVTRGMMVTGAMMVMRAMRAMMKVVTAED